MQPTVTNSSTLYVEQWGSSGPKIVFVHGGGPSGAANFQQQKPLMERWTRLLPDRMGYGKTPANGRRDFEKDAPLIADLLGGGSHLVGHSYGGIIALMAAALRPASVLSLTLIEPAAFRVAMGNLDADQLAHALMDLWQTPPEPESFLHRFFELLGIFDELPSPLPPPLVASGKDMLTNRGPWEADIPVGVLSKAPFRKLVVTSGHTARLEAIADALVIQIGAQRAVIPGMGHNVQNVGAPLNDLLERFWLEKPVTQ